MTTLTQDSPRIDREQLDEIVDIMLETVCTTRKSIRVAGDDYPAELVKAKFLKLDSHHIRLCHGLPAGEHHQSPQHQAIPAGHAVQRPQHHQQLLCVPCGARYGAA